MASALSRRAVLARLTAALADADTLAAAVGQPTLPHALADWLGRLMVLTGVPYSYLVPAEAMLPPESIRFFHVDMNWVDALVDGAFSIGRNLTSAAGTVSARGADAGRPPVGAANGGPALPSISARLDRAARASVGPGIAAAAGQIRARALGQAAVSVSLREVTGFLLRSRAVRDYPGLGVTIYPTSWTPPAPPPQELTLLRFERLGPRSEVLMCLADGVAVQVDVHEPPEHLHYGFHRFEIDPHTGRPSLAKEVRSFSRQGNTVTVSSTTTDTDLSACLRGDTSRTVRVAELASRLGARNAAELGFAMTQGVGMVSFVRRATP